MTPPSAPNCIRRGRLAERGVRFIQLYQMGWDHHEGVPRQLPPQCLDTDQPSAALVLDLKQRGMLDDTLVMWPDRVLPREPVARELRPGSPSALFYSVAGRWWNQTRTQLRHDRRFLLQHSRERCTCSRPERHAFALPWD